MLSLAFARNVPLFLAFSLFAASCDKFENSLNSVSLACGDEIRDEAAATSWIRLLDPDGQPLSQADISALRIQWTDEASQAVVTDTRVTSKGCLRVPATEQERILVAYVADSKRAAVLRLTQRPSGVQDLKIDSVTPPELSLRCDTGVLYTVEKMTNPLSVIDPGSDTKLKVRLDVKDPATGFSTPIFEKRLGQSFSESLQGNELNLSRINEGLYDLSLSVSQPTDDFAQRAVFQNLDKPCQLAVLRTAPKLQDSIFGNSDLVSIRKGSEWPAQYGIRRGNEELKVCKQPFYSSIDHSQTCREIARECQAMELFQPISPQLTAETGIYDFFFIAEDRAGNRSELQCQTIAISNEQPQVELSWDRPEWNLRSAFLQEPVAVISPVITIRDDQLLSRSEVNELMQCKVEFVSPTGFSVRGDDVTCLTGRCKGQTLGDYVPCDDTFSFSLSKAWSNSYVRNSEMKLTLKVDDGAGEPRILSRTLQFSGQRWVLEDMTPGSDPKAGMTAFTRVGDTSWMGLVSRKIPYLFEQGNPIGKEVEPSYLDDKGLDLQASYLANGTDGRVVAAFAYKSREPNPQSGISFARWDGSGWEEIKTITDVASCRAFVPVPKVNAFVCLAQKIENGSPISQLVEWRGENEILGPTELKTLSGFEVERDIQSALSVAEDGSLMVISRTKAYWSPSIGDNFQLVFGVGDDVRTNLTQTLAGKAEHWLYATNLASVQTLRIRTNNGTFERREFVAPPIEPKNRNSARALSRDGQGQIYVFDYRFDDSLEKWVPGFPEATSQFSGFRRNLDQDLDGNTWLRTEAAFWNPNRKVSPFWPSGAYGIEPVLPLRSPSPDEFWFVGTSSNVEVPRIFRFRYLPFVVLNRQNSGLPRESSPLVWTDSEGRLLTQSINRGSTLIFEGGSWKPYFNNPNTTGFSVSEKFRPFGKEGLASILSFGLWVKRDLKTEWETVAQQGDPAAKLFAGIQDGELLGPSIFNRTDFVGVDEQGNVYVLLNQWRNWPITVLRPDGSLLLNKIIDVWPELKLNPISFNSIVAIDKGILIGGDNTLRLYNQDLVKIGEMAGSLKEKLEAGVGEELKKEFPKLIAWEIKDVEGRRDQAAICSGWAKSSEVDAEPKPQTKAERFACFDLKVDEANNLSLGSAWAMPTSFPMDPILNPNLRNLKLGASQSHRYVVWLAELYGADASQDPTTPATKLLTVEAITAAIERDPMPSRSTPLSFHVDAFGRVLFGYQNAGVLIYDRPLRSIE